jgi:hypothetical protein
MTNVKEAVQAAVGFVGELYPEAQGIRLEQVEPLSTIWSVVLSFNLGEPNTFALVTGANTRLYKAIEVDNASGQPRSLKAWKN